MDTYLAIFHTEETEGVYGISLVEDPAMESMFLALSKAEPIQLKSVDKEKRILMGAVLIPDKKVYRNDGIREFNVVFQADTIRMASQKFMMNGHQSSSSIEHDKKNKLKDVTIVESWIKEDAVHDKSVKYGFDEPVGTWYAAMKINNDSVWENYVKTGAVKGFSIDGFFNMQYTTNLNKHEMSTETKNDFKSAFREILVELGLKKPEASVEQPPVVEVKLGSVVTVGENPITINFEGDTLAAGVQVTMTSPEGELPVPDGQYTTEDGKTLNIAGSLVSEVTEAKAADEAPATMSEAPAPVVKSEKHTQEVFYQLSKEGVAELVTELGKIVDEKVAALRVELTSVKEPEVVSLTKTKGEKEKPWEQMTSLERYRASKQHN